MLAAHVNEAESETQGKDRMQAVIPEAQGRKWGEGDRKGEADGGQATTSMGTWDPFYRDHPRKQVG